MRGENFRESDSINRDKREGGGWVCSNCGAYNKRKASLCIKCNLTQAQATKRSLNRQRKSSFGSKRGKKRK